MKNSLHGLSNIRKYCGSSHIQTGNGSTLPIIAVGDVPPFLKDVFVSPKLAINLASVGQLVDNNCDVNFSNRGCIVQDQILPIPSAGSRATNSFEIIHSAVWGISPVISHANYRYFVTFIDYYSRYTWVYFLRHKSEVFSMFKLFLALVNTIFCHC
jgi:hypothetical protein